MARFKLLLSLIGLVTILTGCNDVKFAAVPNKTCRDYINEFGKDGCQVDPSGFNNFNYSIRTGSVDILFIDDNSGSMYVEQTEMANRFGGFLDTIHQLDYNLAITTTDVVQNGGGFLTFPNSKKILSNKSRQMDATHYANIQHFQNTIKRPETLLCDSSGYNTCPSGDERGIYAANLAISRSDQKAFFRKGGHLALVILSDEDERSNGGNILGYPIEDFDKPLTFVQRASQYLSPTKSISVHSIIIKPGDTTCHGIQNSQANVKGYYGYSYAALSQPSAELKAAGNIVDGVLGSICSTNYTTELGHIANFINQTVNQVQLPCKPHDGIVNITYDPMPSTPISYNVDAQNRLNLNPPASAGTKVNLSFKCKI